MRKNAIRGLALFCAALACAPAASASVGKEQTLAATPRPSSTIDRGVIDLGDVSLDKPLVLDEFADYRLRNVSVAGIHDGSALTLVGRVRSVVLEHCSFGRVQAGPNNKAAALDAAGAMVGKLVATDTSFFDAENQLASLKEGSFGHVRFERCRFSISESFLRDLYTLNPWRNNLPCTEFYNIQRLELLDNEFANTTVIIHPSVRQVILRGAMPGLKVRNTSATRVIHLPPGALAESVPGLPEGAVASVSFDSAL